MFQTETRQATVHYGRVIKTFMPPSGLAPALMQFEYQTPDVKGSFFEGTLTRTWVPRFAWTVELVQEDGNWVIHPADRRSHSESLMLAHRDSMKRIRADLESLMPALSGEV